jgi:hypothetical protein
MGASGCINELGRDAQAPSRIAHRAFEHIVHAELTVDFLHVDRLPSVGKARIASHDKQPAELRKRGDDLLEHAVGDIFLLRVAAQIGKGQDGNRRLVGERERGL